MSAELSAQLAKKIVEAVEQVERKMIPVVQGDKIECTLSMMEGCPKTEAVVLGTYNSFRGAVKVTLPNNNVAFIDPRCVLKVI